MLGSDFDGVGKDVQAIQLTNDSSVINQNTMVLTVNTPSPNGCTECAAAKGNAYKAGLSLVAQIEQMHKLQKTLKEKEDLLRIYTSRDSFIEEIVSKNDQLEEDLSRLLVAHGELKEKCKNQENRISELTMYERKYEEALAVTEVNRKLKETLEKSEEKREIMKKKYEDSVLFAEERVRKLVDEVNEANNELKRWKALGPIAARMPEALQLLSDLIKLINTNGLGNDNLRRRCGRFKDAEAVICGPLTEVGLMKRTRAVSQRSISTTSDDDDVRELENLMQFDKKGTDHSLVFVDNGINTANNPSTSGLQEAAVSQTITEGPQGNVIKSGYSRRRRSFTQGRKNRDSEGTIESDAVSESNVIACKKTRRVGSKRHNIQDIESTYSQFLSRKLNQPSYCPKNETVGQSSSKSFGSVLGKKTKSIREQQEEMIAKRRKQKEIEILAKAQEEKKNKEDFLEQKETASSVKVEEDKSSNFLDDFILSESEEEAESPNGTEEVIVVESKARDDCNNCDELALPVKHVVVGDESETESVAGNLYNSEDDDPSTSLSQSALTVYKPSPLSKFVKTGKESSVTVEKRYDSVAEEPDHCTEVTKPNSALDETSLSSKDVSKTSEELSEVTKAHNTGTPDVSSISSPGMNIRLREASSLLTVAERNVHFEETSNVSNSLLSESSSLPAKTFSSDESEDLKSSLLTADNNVLVKANEVAFQVLEKTASTSIETPHFVVAENFEESKPSKESKTSYVVKESDLRDLLTNSTTVANETFHLSNTAEGVEEALLIVTEEDDHFTGTLGHACGSVTTSVCMPKRESFPNNTKKVEELSPFVEKNDGRKMTDEALESLLEQPTSNLLKKPNLLDSMEGPKKASLTMKKGVHYEEEVFKEGGPSFTVQTAENLLLTVSNDVNQEKSVDAKCCCCSELLKESGFFLLDNMPKLECHLRKPRKRASATFVRENRSHISVIEENQISLKKSVAVETPKQPIIEKFSKETGIRAAVSKKSVVAKQSSLAARLSNSMRNLGKKTRERTKKPRNKKTEESSQAPDETINAEASQTKKISETVIGRNNVEKVQKKKFIGSAGEKISVEKAQRMEVSEAVNDIIDVEGTNNVGARKSQQKRLPEESLFQLPALGKRRKIVNTITSKVRVEVKNSETAVLSLLDEFLLKKARLEDILVKFRENSTIKDVRSIELARYLVKYTNDVNIGKVPWQSLITLVQKGKSFAGNLVELINQLCAEDQWKSLELEFFEHLCLSFVHCNQIWNSARHLNISCCIILTAAAILMDNESEEIQTKVKFLLVEVLKFSISQHLSEWVVPMLCLAVKFARPVIDDFLTGSNDSDKPFCELISVHLAAKGVAFQRGYLSTFKQFWEQRDDQKLLCVKEITSEIFDKMLSIRKDSVLRIKNACDLETGELLPQMKCAISAFVSLFTIADTYLFREKNDYAIRMLSETLASLTSKETALYSESSVNCRQRDVNLLFLSIFIIRSLRESQRLSNTFLTSIRELAARAYELLQNNELNVKEVITCDEQILRFGIRQFLFALRI